MIRKCIFWVHLSSGVIAGVVILIMSVTGVLLTFQKQIVDFANREYTTVRPSHPGAAPMELNGVLKAARNAEPEAQPTSVTIRPDPSEAYVVSFGRSKTVFVDPYTGNVRGDGNIAVRDFLREIMYWHRWFGAEGENRAVARAVTGACNLAFCLLTITGLYIWWPRKWTLTAIQAIIVPNLKVNGKSRDFNWHNSFGIWCFPVLFLLSLSGVVISYRWAGDLVYTLTGTEPPVRASQTSSEPEKPEDESAPSALRLSSPLWTRHETGAGMGLYHAEPAEGRCANDHAGHLRNGQPHTIDSFNPHRFDDERPGGGMDALH